MKDVFVPTQNYNHFEELCLELMSSSAGIEMAAIIGRAGRGKTTSAQRMVALNPWVAYVRYEDRFTPVGLIRELAFAVAGVRPGHTQGCMDVIRSELARSRRLIMVDEADRMTLRHLNTMRDFHDVCCSPVVLLGEEPLRARLQRERRLISRTRELLEFGPVTQPDVVVFYRNALGQDVSGQAAELVRHADGDFRMVVRDALEVERKMDASGLKRVSPEVIREVIGK